MTNLVDLLGLEDLQSVQDSFAGITGVSIVLVNTEGEMVTQPSGKGLFVSQPPDKKQRQTLLRKLCQENRITKKAALTTSPATGLTTGAVPVLLGSQHVGSWIVGQILMDVADRGIILRALTDSGMDSATATHALDELPRLTRQETGRVFTFLEDVTRVLTHLARGKYDLVKANAELTALAEQLDSTAQMLTKLTNSADVGLYVVDYFTGEVLQGNAPFSRYTGKSIEELMGGPCWLWVDGQYESFCPDCPHDRLMNETGEPNPPVFIEKYNVATDTWIRFAHQAIYWVDGRLAHMVTMTDITQNKKMQQRLSTYAFFDRALHLPNALKLSQDAQGWAEEAPVYLICYDIVALRNINGLYSRETGDALIAAICQWVDKIELENSTLYRIDGDQFAYAVKGSDVSAVYELACLIKGRFADPWLLSVGSQKVSVYCDVSIGVVCANNGPSAESDLINIIERTLGRSSDSGRVVIYGEEMNLEYKEQLRLENSLELCVKRGMEGFSVYYQPIMDPATGTWCALEALCRWKSPEFGAVQPLVFIHKAEQMGLIIQIGTWVLETAIRECKALGLDAHENFILDVNLSPLQITNDALVPTVIGLLEQYDFPGEKLSLEITESTEVNFTSQTLDAIHRLREAKVLVALDDFGTGYSNFNNLRNLPVSILKTEQAFLRGIESDEYLQYLFYLMVELAHAAGMIIIAEGVETEEQMHILQKNGVDRLQGYLFSPPLPLDQLCQHIDSFFRPSVQLRQPAANMSLEELTDRQHGALSPKMYKNLGQSLHLLLSEPTPQKGGKRSLEFILEQLHLSRGWLCRTDGAGGFRALLSLCGPDEEEPLMSADSPWAERLARQGLIVATHAPELEPALRRALADAGSRARLIFPLCRGGGMEGYAVFDDCVYYREWSAEEVLLLYNAATAIFRELLKADSPSKL